MTNDNPLSEDDKALFRAAVGKVTPLKTTATDHYQPPKPPINKTRAPVFEKSSPPPSPRYLSDYSLEEVESNATLSFAQSGFPRKRMQDLMRGRIPWEARLDLHGFRVEEAGERLSNFISQQYALAKRCLLIIHGKGGHDNAPPILKNRVNLYLPQFPEVLAFHSALAKDGGLGAVYVLLKRHRD